MSSMLLVESGSTKTDWCLLKKGKEAIHFKTSGINPYLQNADEISTLIQKELTINANEYSIESISYYGAGAGNKVKQNELKEILKKHFRINNIEVQCDMLAAARSMCGQSEGIVCILGTGSNSCCYDGRDITENRSR